MDLLDFKRKVLKFEVKKDIIYTPQNTSSELLFESLSMPPWTEFFNMQDLQALYNTINSKRLSANFDKKKAIIDQIMHTRGFKYMHGGTNRHVYVNPDFPWVVAKVPIDAVGMSDNFMEQKNQKRIWPYCAKMIQVTPFGVIGFAERVEPILNRAQFNAYKEMIYLVTIQILGKYVLEDIGTNYFKNWAVRNGFGPVLCDYPYIFELDGNKLVCNAMTPMGYCGGEIDYDDGFNKLYCKRCGKSYEAQTLSLSLAEDKIKLDFLQSKGGQKPMAARLVKGDKVLSSSLSSDSIVRPENAPKKPGVVYTSEGKGARLIVNGKVVSGVVKPATTVGEKIMEKVSSVVSIPICEVPVVSDGDEADRIIVDLAKIKKAVEETSVEEETIEEETPEHAEEHVVEEKATAEEVISEPVKVERTTEDADAIDEKQTDPNPTDGVEIENSETPQKKYSMPPKDPKTGRFMKAGSAQNASETQIKSKDTATTKKDGVWTSGQKLNKSSKTRRIIEESVESGDTTVIAGNRT